MCGDRSVANMKQVHFQECLLVHADLYSSSVLQTQFENCDLDQAQLSGTKLAGIDLSECTFTALGAGLDDLQGCIISPEQAAVFAAQFGLKIKE
ncbi:pentapeptide repeat-containing protein [Paenibacillus thiaminolyticus]|nr:pentapeptide repeat-containing protein [Paenibacillus thiaminolyticus]WII40369.1 pentapeptide repeat-containing protein [Paenibacillus thiaminolyticus]